MFAFCGLTWWNKPEYPAEPPDLGEATTTLPHAITGNQSWDESVTSETLPLHYLYPWRFGNFCTETNLLFIIVFGMFKNS